MCSWSLRPGSAAELVERVRAAGVGVVQLALDPLRTGAWDPRETLARLADAGLALASGMMGMRGEDYSTLETIRRTGGVRPDEHWRANREAARQNARLARSLGIDLVSFHAGFLPHETDDSERAKMLERLRALADDFAAEGVRVALETGQETAETLEGVLAELERPDVGVNFDPANLILYGMGDPVAALDRLAPRVLQVHVKDARGSRTAGAWGDEVPVGEGEVDWSAFLAVLERRGLDVDLMVEREAGERRVEDVATARRLLEGLGAGAR